MFIEVQFYEQNFIIRTCSEIFISSFSVPEKTHRSVCDAGHYVIHITPHHITLVHLIRTVSEFERTLRHYVGSGDIWKYGNTTKTYTLLSVKSRHKVNSINYICPKIHNIFVNNFILDAPCIIPQYVYKPTRCKKFL